MAEMVTFFPVRMLLIQSKKPANEFEEILRRVLFFQSKKVGFVGFRDRVLFLLSDAIPPKSGTTCVFFFLVPGNTISMGRFKSRVVKSWVKCIYNVVPAWFQTEFRPLHGERGSPAAAVFLSVGSRGSAAAEYAGSRASSTRPTIGVAFFATLSQAVCTTASMMSRCAECACASSPLSQLANGLVAPVETHQAVHGARLARSRPWQ